MKLTMYSKISGLLLLAGFLVAPLGAADMRASMTANLTGAQKKFVSLAEAIPASKYNWRPAAGVRSVSEILMHVATVNYFFAGRFGVKPPADFRHDWEKTVTAKAEVIAKLKASFEQIERALRGADLSQTVKLHGGRETTVGKLALHAVSHAHEHLGQLIAYARMNGVVPPWSK